MSKAKTMIGSAALAIFASAMSTTSASAATDQALCEQYINGCDANNDGGVTLEEWLNCSSANGPVIFSEIDADGDGVLTCPEVIIFFRS